MKENTNAKRLEAAIVVSKPTIHVVHILDSSGSMKGYGSHGDKYTPAVQVIATEVETLSTATDVNYTFSLVEFGHRITEQFWKSSDTKSIVSKIETLRNFNEGTRLNDTIGQTLDKLVNENKDGAKILVSILTDGEENASTHPIWRYSHAIKDLVKKCEELGFTITFIGVEKDVALAARSYGLNFSNMISHDNTPESIKMSSLTRGAATQRYAKSVVGGTSSNTAFYSNIAELDEDIERLKNKQDEKAKKK